MLDYYIHYIDCIAYKQINNLKNPIILQFEPTTKVKMYRTCLASLCNTNCCDYYAYCVYPANTLVCYTNVTYYYYDYWWVWTLCSILLLIIICAAIAGARRARMRRMMQNQEIIIVDNTNPGFVSGQPVYGDTVVTGQPYYNQPY